MRWRSTDPYRVAGRRGAGVRSGPRANAGAATGSTIPAWKLDLRSDEVAREGRVSSSSSVLRARRRRPSAAGSSAIGNERTRIPIGSGALRSGKPRRAVEIALAWISGPDISPSPVVGVGCTSCRLGAEAPITTVRPRNRESLRRARSACENDTVVNVPGGPW